MSCETGKVELTEENAALARQVQFTFLAFNNTWNKLILMNIWICRGNIWFVEDAEEPGSQPGGNPQSTSATSRH